MKRRRLEDLLAQASHLPGGIGAQLQWLEDTAEATEDADMGPRGETAAMSMRAALGAVVGYAQGEQTQRDLTILGATLEMLVSHALAELYTGLAEQYDAIAEDPIGGLTAGKLADVWRELAYLAAHGRATSPTLHDRVAALRDTLEREGFAAA